MSVGVAGQTPTRSGDAWYRLRAAVAGIPDTVWGQLLFGFRLWSSVRLALFVAF